MRGAIFVRRILAVLTATLLVGCSRSSLGGTVQAQNVAPAITSAQLNSATGQLTVAGSNFGSSPTVTLGSSSASVVSSSGTTAIVTVPSNLNPGSYLL
jgi:hypothetical protein